ncbi:transposase [Streptomyces shenzhenensis]
MIPGCRPRSETIDSGSPTHARGLTAYAGPAPITRASGKKHHLGRRMVKNDRLNRAGYLWAFSALRSSPGADAHYRRPHRTHGGVGYPSTSRTGRSPSRSPREFTETEACPPDL